MGYQLTQLCVPELNQGNYTSGSNWIVPSRLFVGIVRFGLKIFGKFPLGSFEKVASQAAQERAETYFLKPVTMYTVTVGVLFPI